MHIFGETYWSVEKIVGMLTLLLRPLNIKISWYFFLLSTSGCNLNLLYIRVIDPGSYM